MDVRNGTIKNSGSVLPKFQNCNSEKKNFGFWSFERFEFFRLCVFLILLLFQFDCVLRIYISTFNHKGWTVLNTLKLFMSGCVGNFFHFFNSPTIIFSTRFSVNLLKYGICLVDLCLHTDFMFTIDVFSSRKFNTYSKIHNISTLVRNFILILKIISKKKILKNALTNRKFFLKLWIENKIDYLQSQKRYFFLTKLKNCAVHLWY